MLPFLTTFLLFSSSEMKISHVLLYLFLCLSIIPLYFHEFYSLISNLNNYIDNNTSHSSSTSHQHHALLHRKALASSKFDFTPFLKNHRHRRKHHASGNFQPSGKPGGKDIDPRYGEEKRLVPTGPNPLHH